LPKVVKAVDMLNETTSGYAIHMKGLDPKTRISNMMNLVTKDALDYRRDTLEGIHGGKDVNFDDILLKTDHNIKNALYKLQGIAGKGAICVEIRP
jgi:hypothetical protein